MNKLFATIGLTIVSLTALAQWTTNGSVVDTQLDVRLTNTDSRHFLITNTNSSTEPAKLYLSGDSYGRGLQLGRNDGNHKIFITGDIDAYKSLRFYNTGIRYFSMTNANSSTEPAKLFLSGNNYNRGLQIGRDDGNHKILITGEIDTYRSLRFYNTSGHYFSITNADSPSEPAKLFLSGNGYSRGLQIGRDDGNHKIILTGDVGIGTPDPQSKLAVNGEIRATEVKVLADITVPDYVFEPDYELRTLQETKEYISENKHLPEIPSAKEMEVNGIDLGDMNMRLLKKIEELTLYLIEQNSQNQAQQAKIEQLEKKISQFEIK